MTPSNLFELIDERYEIAPQQRLMLQALILDEPRDRECLASWLEKVDLEAMDYFSLRLVPVLLQKFGDIIGESTQFGRMQGICRYFFFRNSLLFADGRRVVARLIAEGIDVLLFKGIAVSLKYYSNRNLRPMSDVDILVHPQDMSRAEEVLFECGFSYIDPVRDKSITIHGMDFFNSRYSCFDLHRKALLESQHLGTDSGLWQRAVFFDWDGLVVKVMSPEDLILTSIINGVRDDPIRPQWIYDIALIVEAEPALRWETVWGEAKARLLSETVFDALNLVRGIASEIVPDGLLEEFLECDRSLGPNLLQAAITEGRTHRLNGMVKDKVDADFSSTIPALHEGKNTISPAVVPRYIRYFMNGKGDIDRLFLQWRHLPRIAELFQVSNPVLLVDLFSKQLHGGEGYLEVPPGLLSLKENAALPDYHADLTIIDEAGKCFLNPGENVVIKVEVVNDTPYCWSTSPLSRTLLGLTCKLYTEDGEPIEFWYPRTYFLRYRKGYVSFIEPLQKLSCELIIFPIRRPGRYSISLDLVHEHITHFSHHGIQFPRLELEVGMCGLHDVYSVNEAAIEHETFGRETIIINTQSGAYYTAADYASFIWNAIVDGYSAGSIATAFTAEGIFDPAQLIVQKFISKLLFEQLIIPAHGSVPSPRKKLILRKLQDAMSPTLVKRTDTRELAASHPVRQTDTRTGWPHPEGDGLSA